MNINLQFRRKNWNVFGINTRDSEAMSRGLESINDNFETVIGDLQTAATTLKNYKIDLTTDVAPNGASGQVLTSQGTVNPPIWAAVPSGGGSFGSILGRRWQFNEYRTDGSTKEFIGMAGLGEFNGTFTADITATGVYRKILSAASANSAGYWFYGGGAEVGWADHNPTFIARVRTYADITLLRFTAGFYSSNTMPNSDTIAPTKGIFFRYSTSASDPGWVGICGDGTSQTVSAKVADIAVNTVYVLKIVVSGAGTSAAFSVYDSNNSQLGSTQTITANIPTGVAIGPNIGVTPTTSAQKNFGFAFYYGEAG